MTIKPGRPHPWHDRGMSATADAFARFLEVPSDLLDDHDAPAGSPGVVLLRLLTTGFGVCLQSASS
jgi:hypothetical protein